MSLEVAYLIHNVPGRYRLRIPARRRDSAYFANVQQAFAQHEQIHAISANSETAGLLIQHGGLSVAELEIFARQQDLFEVQAGELPFTPMLQQAATQLKALNQELTQVSANNFDLRGIAFVLLVMFGVRELIKGNLFSPAATLFWYATQILMNSEKK